MASYSRTAYLALKKETTEGTAVTPDVFIPFLSEDIVTEWGSIAAQPVANNRTLNIRRVDTAIPSPSGTITIQIEPRNIPHFLLGVFGAVTTGRYIPCTSMSGAGFTAGETITGGTSAATAVVTKASSEKDYVITGAFTGSFTDGETITGGTSAVTATLTKADTAAYGHEFIAPQTTDETYTVEIGYDSEAIRYTGARFNGIKFNSADNVWIAELSVMARYEFKMARVTAVTTSGAGAKTITVDQTTGLATSDTIKLFRPVSTNPSTGAYQDFSAASTKTHTIGTIPTETTFTITTLQTSTAVGDLIVLAPQTPSYSVGNELAYIGQTVIRVDTTSDLIITDTSTNTDTIEEFEINIENKIEFRHAANGANVKDRFPAKSFLMGLTGSGKITRTYTDPTYLDYLRKSRKFALRILCTGAALPNVADFNFSLDLRVADARYKPFAPSVSNDDLLNQEMEFDMNYDSSDAYMIKAIVVNENTSY